MSSTGSAASDTVEHPDYVHECLKYLSIYSKGAFSCSSSDGDNGDDDDDCGGGGGYDEDVKRILAEHDEPESGDCEATGFSSSYEAAAAAVAAAAETTLPRPPTSAADRYYEHWDEALGDAAEVYPPLGAGRFAFAGTSKNRKLLVLGSGGEADEQSDRSESSPPPPSSAQLLRKCLEGALYGQDTEEFAVAQPYCAANKNLDFGKSKMSPEAVHDSRKRVEHWMSKYYVVDNVGPGTAGRGL